MKQNMGTTDRLLRVIMAIAIIVFYFVNGSLSLWIGIALGVAAIFLLTSAISFCPLYVIVGIRTCKVPR